MTSEQHPIVIDCMEGANAIIITPIDEYASEEIVNGTNMTENVEQRLLATIDSLR